MIRQIKAIDTYPVRQAELRKGLARESCVFEGDELPDTVHFGYFIGGHPVGIASLLLRKNPGLSGSLQYQLRGMAVLEKHQGKQIGKKLLAFIEDHIAQQDGGCLWFNARTSAVPFYKKSGYEDDGGIFDIPGVGPHILMFKNVI